MYTEAVVERIFSGLLQGTAMKAICREEGMPHVGTVHNWRHVNPRFAESLAAVRATIAAKRSETEEAVYLGLLQGLNYQEAAIKANVSPSSIYGWRRNDGVLRDTLEQARVCGRALLQLEKEKGMKTVGVNERGLRVGQDHQRAKLTDRDIELFWQLREQGLGCKRLAAKLDISHQHAKRLLKGTQRSQRAVEFKKVAT